MKLPTKKFFNEQLKASDASDAEMLLILNIIAAVGDTMKLKKIDKDRYETVIGYAVELMRGHAIVENTKEIWVDVLPGDFHKRDVVRVKVNAYEDGAGERHNGQRGVIVNLVGGHASVRYDETGEMFSHSPQAIQKLS